ncbi:hypothetical protein MBRA1_002970 [Malassezia brasiliensis]|uniref:Uncharacterized protein n=1 Tax=Malassezia brasiliensis TaxID=1821822 RepID=A0AAF0DUF4_9BASI|nr:hypothetical protein MBRA1_002970 [Malassezia brasiliensis]
MDAAEEEDAAFRAQLATFAYAPVAHGASVREEYAASDPPVRQRAARAPFAPKAVTNTAPTDGAAARRSPTKPRTSAPPPPPSCLDTLPREAIRMLPRCALCASHFAASHSAAKRRTHLVACAAARAVPDSALRNQVLEQIRAELETEYARYHDAQARRTLLDTLLPSAAPAPRWHRWAAQLPLATPTRLMPASEAHRAAHTTLATLLPRLTPSIPPEPCRLRRRRRPAPHALPAPLYEAAYRTPRRILDDVVAALDSRASAAQAPSSPGTASEDEAYVATSDVDEAGSVPGR